MKALLLSAALLLLAIPATASAAPGGACDGLVDVFCTDYAECPPSEPTCEPDPLRRCVVWYTYLDTTLAPEREPVLCQDNPYAGW